VAGSARRPIVARSALVGLTRALGRELGGRALARELGRKLSPRALSRELGRKLSPRALGRELSKSPSEPPCCSRLIQGQSHVARPGSPPGRATFVDGGLQDGQRSRAAG